MSEQKDSSSAHRLAAVARFIDCSGDAENDDCAS
jgi:hypothetical protein